MLYVCLVSLDVNNCSMQNGAKLLRHLHTLHTCESPVYAGVIASSNSCTWDFYLF